MRASEAVVIFLFAVPFPAFRYCMNTHSCPPAQPGKCSADTYTVTNDEVCTPTAADCTFSNSQGLCYYTQGCRDLGMTNWTAVNGKATSKPGDSGACGQGCCFSVMESPWLGIDHTSCLTFSYNKGDLAALDVFLETRETGVVSALYSYHDFDTGSVEREDVPPGVRKVIFRAHSEAGAPSGDAYISIKKVSVVLGHCALSDCDFSDSLHHHFCGWDNQGWRTTSSSSISGSTSGDFVAATFSSDQGGHIYTLTTPLIAPSSTPPDKTGCLWFTYGIQGSTDAGRMNVSVQPFNGNTTFLVWSDAVVGPSWRSGRCPIQVPAPYKILFTAEKSGNGTVEIVLDTIRFSRAVRNENCQSTPTTVQDIIIQPTDDWQTDTICAPVSTSTAASQSVATHHVVSTAGATTATTQLSSSSTEQDENNKHVVPTVGATATTTHFSSSSTEQDENNQRSAKTNNIDDDDGVNVAVIGGAVAAVIVIIIVVVIIIVIVLRRRQWKRSDDESRGTLSSSENSSGTENRGETMKNELYGIENSCMTSSTSPYDLAEDGAPGKTRTAPSRGPEDDDNHIPTTKPPQPTAPALVDVDDSGDFCSITNGHNGAQTDVSAMYSRVQKKGKKAAGQPAGPGGAVYSQVNKKGKGITTAENQPDPGAVYSQVNKKGKGITTAENQPDPGAVYSQVNKKGNKSAGHYDVPPAVNRKPGKPVIAPKPGQGKQPTGPAKNQVPGDTTGVDPYDTIDTVPSPGRPQPLAIAGDVETDEYNSLDFDAARRVKTETGEVEEAAGPYNYLYDDASDGYSRAGEAKKKVVIGSDYDDVQA